MTRYRNTCGVGRRLRFTLAAVVMAAIGSPAHAESKAKPELVASVNAIAPGQAFQIALRFEVADGWHLYWANPGDAGLPPRLRWTTPAGFEMSPPRFPTPKRHLGPGTARTNILKGHPILLVDVVAPPELSPGRTLDLTLNVDWLVCKSTCLREKQEVTLTLPVVASAKDVQPANADLFKRARKAVPKSNSEYLTVRTLANTSAVQPGDSFEIVLQISIKDGLRIQSDKPTVPGLVATDVFVEPVADLSVGAAIYPPAQERTDKFLGRITEFGGQCFVRLPVTADKDLANGPVAVSGVLVFQACEKTTGRCFRPEAIEWTINLPRPGAAGS